ncbi:hypothetical protein BGZ49_005331 [Haplosporangium sp. Z 27]|nr:hypothetical protein BGZ49_005331 [Haplosporangium sp. Z 27]
MNSVGSGGSAVVKSGDSLSLTEVIKSAKSSLYSATKLPPVPTIRNYKWTKSLDQPPVLSGTYWTMNNMNTIK